MVRATGGLAMLTEPSRTRNRSVGRNASMAEDSVTNAEGLAETATKARRVRKPKAPPPEPVKVTEVNRGLWATAKELSEGDPRRIEILAHNRVCVHGTPRT